MMQSADYERADLEMSLTCESVLYVILMFGVTCIPGVFVNERALGATSRYFPPPACYAATRSAPGVFMGHNCDNCPGLNRWFKTTLTLCDPIFPRCEIWCFHNSC